jgi:hypothetical protein
MTGQPLGIGARIRCGAWAMAVVLACSAPAAPQTTRAEQIEQRQQEKAAALAAYQPTLFERAVDRIEQFVTDPPNGVYPAVGSVYPGGGLAGGAMYQRFFARKAVWDVSGLYSVHGFGLLQSGVRTPWAGHGRLRMEARGGWLYAREAAYFGTGMRTIRADRADLRLSRGHLAGSLRFQPSTSTRLEGELALEKYSSDVDADLKASLGARYGEEGGRALLADPTYVRTRAIAAIDARSSPEYARRGGYYAVTLNDYRDTTGPFSFRRLDADLVQHVPVLQETWILSWRGRVETLLGDDAPPLFLLPSLGGAHSLRADSFGRFRDRHTILTTAELRWTPSRQGLDMALFVDAGKVTAHRRELDLRRLRTNWGIGARFHATSATVLRIEAAHGRDGWRAVFATSAAF